MHAFIEKTSWVHLEKVRLWTSRDAGALSPETNGWDTFDKTPTETITCFCTIVGEVEKSEKVKFSNFAWKLLVGIQTGLW